MLVVEDGEELELEGERSEHPLVVVGGCKVGRSVGKPSAGKSEGLIGFGGSGWIHVIEATSFSPKRILI